MTQEQQKQFIDQQLVSYDGIAWSNAMMKAKQNDLAAIVDALCRYMEEHHKRVISMKDNPLEVVVRCKAGSIQPECTIFRLLYKKRQKKNCILIEYVLTEYLDNDPIVRQRSIKHVEGGDIETVKDRLVEMKIFTQELANSICEWEDHWKMWEEYCRIEKERTVGRIQES